MTNDNIKYLTFPTLTVWLRRRVHQPVRIALGIASAIPAICLVFAIEDTAAQLEAAQLRHVSGRDHDRVTGDGCVDVAIAV